MFERPEWFMLLAVVPVAWRYREVVSKYLGRIRYAVLSLLFLALCGLQVPFGSGGLDLWVLVDRSASFDGALGRNFNEWSTLLERSRPMSARLRYVDFASSARERSGGSSFEDSTEQTKIGAALRYVTSRFDPARSNRVLLVSDGFATDSLAGVAELLTHAGAPLDVRLSSGPEGGDAAITGLDAPTQVAPGESFIVELSISGATDTEVSYVVSVNGSKRASGTTRLRNGRSTVQLSDTMKTAGSFHYEATIAAPGDSVPGNNGRETWIEVSGKGHILLLSRYTPDPVAESLRRSGWHVIAPTDLGRLNAGSLTSVRAVILNDIHASSIPRAFLDALPFYVQYQGGGLMLLGGKESFGSGGYFNSPIDPLLPVNMELRNELRRVSVTMALVLDRSGSMGTSVEGNMGSMTKMDLANEGAARTTELLSQSDALAVWAVDTEPHTVVELQKIGDGRSQIQRRLRSITSTGGGIYVYEGLSAAWKVLKSAGSGRKHIVLFSDASDSEEPGKYADLLSEIVAAKGSVSVIGLGSPASSDAALLKDIAQKGDGRIFFVDNAMDLPAVFAQETVSVARSLFVDEATGTLATPAWKELSSTEMQWPSTLEGYNLAYLKPEASTALLTKDQYSAPLVAYWRRGAGRAATVAFPLSGDRSGTSRGWKSYSEFLGTITTWLAAPEAPAGMTLRTRLEGTSVAMTLHYAADLEAQVLQTPPKLTVARQTGVDQPVQWERLAPGRFGATLELTPGETVRGAVQIGRFALPFGPLGSQSRVEWHFDPRARSAAREVVTATGGRELVNLADAWLSPSTKHPYSLSVILTSLALVLFLVDALLRRIGFQYKASGWNFALRVPALPLRWGVRSRPTRVSSVGKKDVQPKTPPAPQKRESLLARQLAKAKRRGKE